MNTPDVLVVSAIGGAFSLLTGTIGWLYRKNSLENTRRITALEKRADECQKDRDGLAVEVGKLTGNSELLARCPGSDEGDCPLWTPARRKEHLDYVLASCPIRNKTPNKKTSRVPLPPAPPPTT